MAKDRLLTTAECVGHPDSEGPLTDADMRRAVTYAYSDWRAEAALAGEPHGREAGWGCAGRDGTVSIRCMADRRGLWACVDTRASHIPWKVAEQILRDNATPTRPEQLLFDLELT